MAAAWQLSCRSRADGWVPRWWQGPLWFSSLELVFLHRARPVDGGVIAAKIDPPFKGWNVAMFSEVRKRVPHTSWGVIASVSEVAKALTPEAIRQCPESSAPFLSLIHI